MQKHSLKIIGLTIVMTTICKVDFAQPKMKIPDIKLPDGKHLNCVCFKNKCSGGSKYSFRRACAVFHGGTGDCSAWSKQNCEK